MGIPPATTPVPPSVRRRAGGRAIIPVWENEEGGVTFRIDGDPGRHIKWGPPEHLALFRREADRLEWAARWVNVPRVLELDADDADGGVILVSESISARSAVDPHWIARPERAVRACGEALRLLHETLPVAECPFSWSVPERVTEAASRGVVVPAELRDPPPVDRLVVCHGDPCVPNTLLDPGGAVAAFVDLGALGVADRWADLAVGSMSIGWNYGEGFEHLYFEGYGIEPEPERIDFYRRLWHAS